jgi:inner membrane protein
MDNLTHSLVGLMISRCGLGETLPKRGALMMVLAANMPDADLVLSMGSSVTYLENHRGFTHSLTYSPLMALLPLLLVCGFGRIRPTWQAWVASWIGVLSHLLLDWTNIYGIRLALPFRPTWFHLDITDVVDPWIWLILLFALAAPALSAMVGSEIASAKKEGPKRSWAIFALVALMLYDGARFVAHQRAISTMQSHLYEGISSPRFFAVPSRLNPLSWRGIVVGDDAVLNVPIELTGEYNPADGHLDHQAPPSAALAAARGTRPFQVLADFNQVPFWSVQQDGDSWRVQLVDLRFGTPQHPGFVATAVVGADGMVRDSEFGMSLPRK